MERAAAANMEYPRLTEYRPAEDPEDAVSIKPGLKCCDWDYPRQLQLGFPNRRRSGGRRVTDSPV